MLKWIKELKELLRYQPSICSKHNTPLSTFGSLDEYCNTCDFEAAEQAKKREDNKRFREMVDAAKTAMAELGLTK
jgi:hypothetical protein